MFAKKTVFVIGAGAGVDYNMPLGSDLKSNIESKLEAREDEMWHSMQPLFELHTQAGADAYRKLKKFISSNMSRAESIDNFLHTHNANEKLVAIGKTAIAACILDAERGSTMMPRTERYSDDMIFLSIRSNKETWLQRFCTMALTGVVAADAVNAFANVTLVTFNYDRCIEMYLVGHIRDYLGITEESAQRIVDRIDIIHVYGKVGRLPWQSGTGPQVAFGTRPDHSLLTALSKEIRTFTERLEDDDTQERIEDKLRQAEIVVFTGFSFGSSNWEFLQNKTGGKTKTAIAGMVGISQANRENIADRLRRTLDPALSVIVHTSGSASLDLLYEYSTFFE